MTADLRELPVEAYKRMVLRVVKAYPNIQGRLHHLARSEKRLDQQLGRNSLA